MRKKYTQQLAVAVIIFVTLGIIQFCVNPMALIENSASVNKIRNELPIAKERWLSSHISNYQIEVQVYIPLSCMADARLTVHDSKLTEVAVRKDIADKNSSFVRLAPEKWDGEIMGCNYNDLTIEAMVKRVEEALIINIWDVAFNTKFDSQYGYVTSYEIRSGYRTGGVSDCCTWFKYKNFEIISP